MPGAFELPLVAKYAAESGRFDAVVCLGAVIRGETDHYDYVCAEAAEGIARVQLDTGVPCGFGVLTVDTMEQALARVAGGAKRDTGRHAVEAVLASLDVKDELSGPTRESRLLGLSAGAPLGRCRSVDEVGVLVALARAGRGPRRPSCHAAMTAAPGPGRGPDRCPGPAPVRSPAAPAGASAAPPASGWGS